MNMQELTKGITRETIRKSPCGCESVFVPINDEIGIKLYDCPDRRDDLMELQALASKHDLGPEVFGIVDLPESVGTLRFGFVTERVECCGDDQDELREDIGLDWDTYCNMHTSLDEALCEIGITLYDMHESNCGLRPDGSMVCIDFGG